MNHSLSIIVIGILLTGFSAWSADQVGTLTQIQGTVKIFSNPTKTPPTGGGTHALFEGEYFQVDDAKVGAHLDEGNILRTAPGAKARVVFPNGDQINVASGTAYRIHWDKDDKTAKTDVNLMYGKIRGVIAQGGPRSHLKIRTRSAVMGVRGTDFFIADGGKQAGTEISIIRGSVDVTPVVKKDESSDKKGAATESQAKPIQIQAGFSAEINPIEIQKDLGAKNEAVEPKVELRKTTQEEFAGIQKSSTIVASKGERLPASDDATQKKIEELEKQATTSVLKDIKKYDKVLYAALEKQPGGVTSVDAINQAALQTLIKEAPKAPEKHKPYMSELENLENGSYDKYFKSVD